MASPRNLASRKCTVFNSHTEGPRALGRRGRHGAVRGMFFHGESKLQRLLLAPLDHLFPELTLVLNPLELRLDVLLRDLEQSQNAVVRLLRDHVQDVAEALRATLAPGFVDAEGHVLRAVLPTKELDVRLRRISAFSIVESRPREDTNHLRE